MGPKSEGVADTGTLSQWPFDNTALNMLSLYSTQGGHILINVPSLTSLQPRNAILSYIIHQYLWGLEAHSDLSQQD